LTSNPDVNLVVAGKLSQGSVYSRAALISAAFRVHLVQAPR
jgi:hypothetical protein